MIDQIFSSIARFVNRRPRVVVGIIGIVFIVAIIGMTMITMQTGNDTYMDRNSPEGIANTQYTETFNTDSIILIVETGNPLDPNVLNYIDRLEGNIRQQQHISGASSVVDILKSENNGVLPQSKGEIDSLVNEIPPATRARAVPSNVLTLVQVNLDNGLSTNTETMVLNTVQQIVDHSDPPAGVTVEVSGTPAFSKQMQAEMGSSMGVLIGGAMILMIIVMGLLFSYVSHRFLPVVFVGLGLTTAIGLMGLAGIPLNMAVLGAFPVMIGLGIDYAIQFHARLDEESRKGSLDDAVFMTITRTGPAVMYAMLATSLGFSAMFISTVPMIQSFGLVAIIGIMSLLLHLARGNTGGCPHHRLQAQAADTRGLLCSWRRGLRYPPGAKEEGLVLWPVPHRYLCQDREKPDPDSPYCGTHRSDRFPARPVYSH